MSHRPTPVLLPLVVLVIASSCARLDRRDAEGKTPLYKAAEQGALQEVRRLIEHGADPNAASLYPEDTPALLKWIPGERFTTGRRPLHAAAYNGQAEIARLLLEHGASVDETSDGWTALQHAAANGHTDTLAVLVLCGADVAPLDPESKETPLQKAVQDHRADVVRPLLEYGADPNAGRPPSSPPIARAAREGYLDIVKLLVLFGADVNVKDGRWTPLRLAELGGHQAVTDLLRQQGGRY